MVVIYKSEGNWRALSIDGYFPGRKKAGDIFKLYDKRRKPWWKPITETVATTGDIILESASHITSAFFTEKKLRLPYLDIFLMKPKSYPVLRKKYAPIEEEFRQDRHPNRNILVCMQDSTNKVDPSEELVGNLVEKLQIRVKEPSSYKDVDAFTGTCEQLLDDALNFYVAPCMELEEYLKRSGFHCEMD